MFSIMTGHVTQECGQIEAQVSEITGQMLELEDAIRQLRSISCMEEAVAKLEYLHSEMDFERTVLRQMMLGLNQTILSYLSCENRICDNGEQSVLYHARRETGINDLSGISNILSGL